MSKHTGITAFLAFFILLLSGSGLHAEILTTRLSLSELPITPDFRGQHVTIVGSIQQADDQPPPTETPDVVITISGPAETYIVHHKEKILGVWLNKGSDEYYNVPSYLQVLSTKPVDTFLNEKTQHKYRASLKGLFIPSVIAEVEKDRSHEALLRLKQEQNLYSQDIKAIEFFDRSSFFVTIFLPANLPIGNYKVDSYLFHKSEVITQDTHDLKVFREGLSSDIFALAERHPLLYGLTTLFILILIAYTTHLIVRKG